MKVHDNPMTINTYVDVISHYCGYSDCEEIMMSNSVFCKPKMATV